MVNTAYDNNDGTTCGLFLRVIRLVWGSGRELVLYSGSFVLWVIIELIKVGYFFVAVIKNKARKKNVDKEAVKEHFSGN